MKDPSNQPSQPPLLPTPPLAKLHILTSGYKGLHRICHAASRLMGILGAGQTSILNGPVLTVTVLPAVENTKRMSMVYSPIGVIQPTFG